MKLPTLKIANLDIKYPIVQGGMAIKASMSRLAAAVANEGGIGLIAGTALSIKELKDFWSCQECGTLELMVT